MILSYLVVSSKGRAALLPWFTIVYVNVFVYTNKLSFIITNITNCALGEIYSVKKVA